MPEDKFTDLMLRTLDDHIEAKRAEGLSDTAILERINKIDFTEIFSKMAETVAINTVETLEKTMYERVLEERAQTAEFMARHEQIWGKGFVASEAMYIMVLETVDMYRQYVDDLPAETIEEKQYHLAALRQIHARACQQFLEITYLIKAGFADGAFARWRSMYELSVVADFLINNDESVALAFIESADSDDSWHNWAKAAPCFAGHKGNITFNDIQNKCDLSTDVWRKQYKLANKVVHASPQGTFNILGAFVDTSVLQAGHSDYGVSLAAEHSAISLAVITASFLTILPYGDGTVHASTIGKWVDIVRKYYYEAEDRCFSEKNEMHATKIDGTVISTDLQTTI